MVMLGGFGVGRISVGLPVVSLRAGKIRYSDRVFGVEGLDWIEGVLR